MKFLSRWSLSSVKQKRIDDILTQMDEKGISDKKLRKSVAKVKEESGTSKLTPTTAPQ